MSSVEQCSPRCGERALRSVNRTRGSIKHPYRAALLQKFSVLMT